MSISKYWAALPASLALVSLGYGVGWYAASTAPMPAPSESMPPPPIVTAETGEAGLDRDAGGGSSDTDGTAGTAPAAASHAPTQAPDSVNSRTATPVEVATNLAPAAPADTASPFPETTIDLSKDRVTDTDLKRGMTIYDALRSLGLTKQDTHAAITALGEVVDVKRLRAGIRMRATAPALQPLVSRVSLKLDERREAVIHRTEAGGWTPQLRQADIIKKTAAYAGTVTSSLWNSALQSGMDPDLIVRLSEVFAWQIDFSREVQPRDRWRLTVERVYADGKPIGFGDILAAEYENAGTLRSAVRFVENGSPRYYTPTGQSLQRMFLKAPIKFGRVTSGFSSRRFHPILKVAKAHLGVDYGAPTGTPVLSIGDGQVTFVGNRGASGRMVSIRHGAIYETHYKHLSGYAAGVSPGAKVTMGQTIGYVGQSGLATGPHLHFELHEGGKYVDPQAVEFPSGEPVAETRMAEFKAQAESELKELPPWSAAVLVREGPKGKDGGE